MQPQRDHATRLRLSYLHAGAVVPAEPVLQGHFQAPPMPLRPLSPNQSCVFINSITKEPLKCVSSLICRTVIFKNLASCLYATGSGDTSVKPFIILSLQTRWLRLGLSRLARKQGLVSSILTQPVPKAHRLWVA